MRDIADPSAGSFEDSMPDRYRATFDAREIREHAAIVARRAGSLVQIEVWQRLPDGGAALCVVADDRPGLLAFISAALVVQNIDISAARAYTRTHPRTERAEAIDFLWVKRAAEPALPLGEADVARIAEVVTSLVTGKATVESVLRKGRHVHEAMPGAPAHVSFDASPDQESALLIVEAADRPGLLLAITQALFRSGVQIVTSDATTQDGRVVDRFTLVEGDGTPVGRQRRVTVQAEVLSAIEALLRLTSKRRSTRPPKPRSRA
jgi:[protein-PII] uridylyltransferase